MKSRPSLLFLAIFLIIIFIAFYLYLHQNKNSPPVLSSRCGLQECHGLNLTCGPNVPDVCTEIYMLGDGCRRFANCQVIAGNCQLQIDSKFTACKSCVEECQRNDANQPDIFACESKCL
ncbi:MAG: hypothetical protein WC686_03835 [Candidatus Shapirobacteria bacterium]|jgi:hypothetical protein